MQLYTKTQILILVAAFVIGAALGGLIHPGSETKIKSQLKSDTTVKQDKDIHEHTVTTITKTPGGTTTTRIDLSKDTVSTVLSDKSSVSQTTSDVIVGRRVVNISAIVGVSIHDPLIPIYGVSVSKPVLANLTVGAFGLSNGMFGASVGWDF